jgi:hypothetical protein
MKFFSFAAAAAVVALAALPASAAVINGDFSAGTSGWTPAGNGSFDVVTSTEDGGGNLFQFGSGRPFALLTAGGPVDDPETISSQAFDLAANSVLSFQVAFLAFDTSDFDDNVLVTLTNNDTGAVFTLFSDDIVHTGDNATDGPFSISQAFGAGNYTFTASVQNVGDDPTAPDEFDPMFSSKLAVANVAVTAGGVPEPTSWALMLVGFAGLGAALRARRSAGSAQSN